MADEMVEKSLQNYGFAQVLVTLQPTRVALSAAAKAQADASVVSYFLDRAPDSVGRAAAAANPEEGPGVPAVRVFPHLGVACGYVDRAGLQRLDQDSSITTVHSALPLSLIRPVGARRVRSKSKMTWGLLRLRIKRLWDQGLTGKGVKVGHLDTGIDGEHPALRDRLKAFLEVDLMGDRVEGAAPRDSDKILGHGTHTAGTICGSTVGGTAIGVAPGVELFSGLVIDGGQVLLRVLQGMEWALERKVRILNMSLGFRGFTPFFLEITQRLRDEGVLPIFAIGNEGVGTSRSPGNYPQALSVGAFDRSGRMANFSSSITFNRPDEPNQPNVVAPGVEVLSAKPGGGLRSLDGSSMATPHVAGVAALLWEAKPTASVSQIENAIQTSCKELEGEDSLRFGFGQVDPVAALAAL